METKHSVESSNKVIRRNHHLVDALSFYITERTLPIIRSSLDYNYVKISHEPHKPRYRNFHFKLNGCQINVSYLN